MMGISIDGAMYIYRDSVSIINYTSTPESVLQNKKNNELYYHSENRL